LKIQNKFEADTEHDKLSLVGVAALTKDEANKLGFGYKEHECISCYIHKSFKYNSIIQK
jgi:hypothetical protein